MKDVEYFKRAEREYQKTLAPGMIYSKEAGGFEFPFEPLGFLRRGRFELYSKNGFKDDPKYNTHYSEFGLTDVEVLMLRCFYADMSMYFRDDYYQGEVPEVAQEMQNVLESIIQKAPQYEGSILHRKIKYPDPEDLKVGDIYYPSHSLTTSVDEFDKEATSYIITCLPNKKTKAHSLFKIYHHGNEKQVNFPKGTRFVVTKVEEKENNVKKIYMKEQE